VPVVGNLPGTTAAAGSTTTVVHSIRPTDPLLPTVAQVAAYLPRRGSGGTFRDPQGSDRGTTPSYTQVASILSTQAAEVDVELVDTQVPPGGTLAAMATLCIIYAAAATIESTFFPESDGAASLSGILWARYTDAMIRLRALVTEQGRGVTQQMSGTIRIGRDRRRALDTAWNYPLGYR